MKSILLISLIYLPLLTAAQDLRFIIRPAYVDSLYQSRHYVIDTHDINLQSYSPIQLRIYNTRGSLSGGWATCFGNIKKANFLLPDSISPRPWWRVNERLSLANDLRMIKEKINLDSLENAITKQYDWIVFALHASYYRRHVKPMEETVRLWQQSSMKKRILIIWLDYAGADR